MFLDEKVSLLAQALAAADIPHAFGGAIALAYHATPRGTRDVDINLFLPTSEFDRVLVALQPLGVAPPTIEMRKVLERDEQLRLYWDDTPIDLFFSYNELHDACVARKRTVPFGSEQIAILSAEDLAVFKTLFARDKDWRDLREMIFAQAPDFDADYATGWLERILAPDDERMLRFREILGAHAAS
jgi:hypothetical protein